MTFASVPVKIAVAHRAPWDPAVREEDFTEDCKSISGLASWFGFYGQAAAVGMKAIDCDFLFAKEQTTE